MKFEEFPKPSWLVMNIRAVFGRAYPRIIGVNRELSWVFFETVLPLLGVAGYVYVYKALEAPAQYIGYVIIGGAMTAYWMNVLWSMAAQMYWEKEMGNLELYLIAPISRMSVLGGMALGGMFSSSVRALSTIFVGMVVFGISLSLPDPLMFTGIFIFTMIALYGMGMMFASLYMLWGREAWHMSSLFTEPIYLVSGFYFPVKGFVSMLGNPGFWIAAGASIIPITLGLDGMRQCLYPGNRDGFLPLWLELAILVALSVLFLFLAKYSLAYMENLGKREGRLTMRWQ
ncbi:MAG: ABC transporter permease [Thermoplasmata archaeon]|nr:ABC transporter permease [Thermoplasmata archaeon]